MIGELDILFKQLKDIRTYLIKIGPNRRHGNILTKKFNEIKEIFSEYTSITNKLSVIIKEGKVASSDILYIGKLCTDFNSIYEEVVALCNPSYIFEKDKTNTTMDFDLKTALSLLPVMNDEVHITRQLIDSIEYYESTLKDTSKPLLIIFVLKSRLSQSAKLRLSPSYNTVTELVDDMKKMLLPQKSATALQNQLLNAKQNDMSLNDYGNKIAELFTELTISQSGGNSDNYKVLRPLNEKMAIKRFADGLRNRRLNTIISAKNFDSLKDAVQTAIDEDMSSPSSTQDIMTMRYTNNYINFRTNNRLFRGQHTRARFNRGSSYHGPQRGNYIRSRNTDTQLKVVNQGFRNRGRGTGVRSRQASHIFSGRSYCNRYISKPRHQQMNVATDTSNHESESNFFRD